MLALVIDDSKAVRGILVKMLRELGFETSQAENGQRALDLLQEIGEPDLFVVNWNMPLVDGLQFIRAVRADRRHAKAPVVVVSGESERRTIDRAMEAGANEFLVKPVAQQSLRKALSRLGLPVDDVKAAPEAAPPTAPPQAAAAPPAPSKPQPSDAGPAAIRLLVVDDSVVVRGIVSQVLEEDPDLEVAATAADGRIALNKLASARPDVILLDIEMPNMDGLEMLDELRKADVDVPVIMFSSLTEHGASATVDALLRGAKDYVPKPGGAQMKDAKAGKQAIREELIPKIKQLAPRSAAARRQAKPVWSPPPQRARPQQQQLEIVAVGVSTGGPRALAQILPALTRDCPVPIVIVQHMPPTFTKHLAERLASECGSPVDEAAEGQLVEAGRVLIAPGGHHMLMTRIGRQVRVRLTQDPPVKACRPSVDVLLESVAKAYGAGSLAVVLTGMGDDGAGGCEEICKAGGQVIVQDEPTSVVWGMPGSVVRAGSADEVLPLEAIAAEISRRVWEKRTRTSMS